MENTTPFLFDDVEPKYFLAYKGKAIGPLTAQEIYQRIQKGEIGLLNYVWKEGWTDWKSVKDEQEFSVLIPQKPSSAAIAAIKQKLQKKKAPEPQAAIDDDKKYYLYFSRTQYGPFSKKELAHVLSSHKLDRNAYLWTQGWTNWKRVSELEEFASFFPPALPGGDAEEHETQPKIRPSSRTVSKKEKSRKIDASEKRGGPRKPLVARLFLHNDQDVIVAVCRDISVGGMQVLTDRVPGEVGSRIKLNVSPGGSASKVQSFVAEGEIVRVLEDGRGFSFRFTKINDDARKAIKKYIDEGM